MKNVDTARALEAEIVQLYGLVQRLREELAGVTGPATKGQMLDRASDQLSAVAGESEEATQGILDSAEKIAQVSSLLRREIKYAGARQFFDMLDDASRAIMERCQVHDIIGQRIARIVRTLNTVEGTISALVVTVGDGCARGVPTALVDLDPRDGDLSLRGPAINGDPDTMDQSAIDTVFEQRQA